MFIVFFVIIFYILFGWLFKFLWPIFIISFLLSSISKKSIFGRRLFSKLGRFNFTENINNMFDKQYYRYDQFNRSKNQEQTENQSNSGHRYYRPNTNRSSGSIMTKKDAYAVLGIKENATKVEIKKAYYDLMKKVHPDYGGSQYLATQINRAKELLLDES